MKRIAIRPIQVALLAFLSCFLGSSGFQPLLPRQQPSRISLAALAHHDQRVPPQNKPATLEKKKSEHSPPTFDHHHDETPSSSSLTPATTTTTSALILAMTVWMGTPTPAMATAGPFPSAILAWLHFLGIAGVAGGLMTERFLIKKNMPLQDEIKINNADGIYGLSAFSLLISGYFRVTEFAKGWDFYKNEPIFWLKMSSVAVLGGLSFFPAIVFLRRDQARQKGDTLAPLSDALVERITTLINAELLAFITIPLLASLMARGVLYVDNFPWALGVVLYVVSLGGAGYKYGKEAFEMMESEGALVPLSSSAQEEEEDAK